MMFVVSLISMVFANRAMAADEYQRVKVVEPFLELRTGAGRLFPVFYVVERDNWIEIHRRRTGWFKVRTSEGKEGWVSRAEIEKTLTSTGENKQVYDTLLENYLQKRAEIGVVSGQLEGVSLIGAFGTWKLSDIYSSDVSFSQASALFSTTRLTNINLMAHPFTGWRVSPFFSIGLGKLRQSQSRSQIGISTVDVWTANTVLGVRSYVTRNFVFRGYTRYTNTFVDDVRTTRYSEWALGLSFFF